MFNYKSWRERCKLSINLHPTLSPVVESKANVNSFASTSITYFHDFLPGAAETENAFGVALPLHLMFDWGTVDTKVTHYCILKKVHSGGLLWDKKAIG